VPQPPFTPEPRVVGRSPSLAASPVEPQGQSLSIADVYYTLFRHKWKIIFCTFAGFGLALALYKLQPPPYQTEAKLFVRYVITEGRSLGPGRDDTITKSPDQRGETIIKSELEILTSMDLAEEVAKNLGAEKILARPGNDATIAAAIAVSQGLVVEVPPSSSVIHVAYQHKDPLVAQAVLKEVIASYLKKHVEIHRAVGLVGDYLTQETDQLRARLAQTEEDLRLAMNKAGVISLEESKRSFGEQIARLRQQIFDSQAELAERTSILKEMTKGPGATATATSDAGPPLPTEQIEAYQKTATRLAQLLRREQDLLANYTEQSTPVQEIRSQLAEAETQKKKQETEFPALKTLLVAQPAKPNQAADTYNPATEAAHIVALQAKIKVQSSQLEEVRAEATKVDQLEINILELRRRKELEEANYRYYSANLEQSRIKEALGTGRVSNISVIENPTPPIKNGKKTKKIVAGIAAAGLVAGLAWAFLIELFLDRTIRRSTEIERNLQLPLFLTIPRIKTNKARKNEGIPVLELPNAPTREKAKTSSEGALLPSDGELALNPFYETLRDRLINYFDTLNVRHKPKLVAVTGLGKDSGVTTIAAGLARSFSVTGEGNVLLVDMTKGQGSAQHFYKGATGVGLEQMLKTKDSAQVHENLYVVSEDSNSDRLAKGMPQRFNQLIPKLKASDFDYIIFDMPAVSQISITPRLASFMDMILLVIESEKTDRDMAANASALLAKSQTPVGVVLNKTKTYVPHALQQDTINDL